MSVILPNLWTLHVEGANEEKKKSFTAADVVLTGLFVGASINE